MSENPNNRMLAVSQKIYGWLLRAYPQGHREQYGSAMAQLFRDQCRDAWTESQNWGVVKLWLHVVPDLVSTSILERLAALNERKSMNDKLANLFSFRTTPAIAFFRVFVPVFVLVFGANAVITFILPESYASTARIKVEPDIRPLGGYYDATNFLQTTLGMIQSEPVLDPVIDKLHLNMVWGKKYNGGEPLETTNTLAMLKSRISLAPVRNTTLINITVYSEDKNEAAQIANAIAKSYQDYRIKTQVELTAKGIDALQQQYQNDEEQMTALQTSLDQLRRKLKINDQDPQAIVPISAMSPEEQPYWDKKRDLVKILEFHKLLAAKIASEEIDIQIPLTSMAKIVDSAMPGQASVRPNKTLNIVLGTFFGILLASVIGGIAALIAFLIRKRTRKIPTTA